MLCIASQSRAEMCHTVCQKPRFRVGNSVTSAFSIADHASLALFFLSHDATLALRTSACPSVCMSVLHKCCDITRAKLKAK